MNEYKLKYQLLAGKLAEELGEALAKKLINEVQEAINEVATDQENVTERNNIDEINKDIAFIEEILLLLKQKETSEAKGRLNYWQHELYKIKKQLDNSEPSYSDIKEVSYAFSWDWKENPDISAIMEATSELLAKGLKPVGYEIETGSDEDGYLVTIDVELSIYEVNELWESLMNQEYEEEEE